MLERNTTESKNAPQVMALPPEFGTTAEHQHVPGPQPTNEEIAREAYAIFEANGWSHGHDIEHWLEAERRLQARTQQAASDLLPDQDRPAAASPSTAAKAAKNGKRKSRG